MYTQALALVPTVALALSLSVPFGLNHGLNILVMNKSPGPLEILTLCTEIISLPLFFERRRRVPATIAKLAKRDKGRFLDILDHSGARQRLFHTTVVHERCQRT